MTLPEVIQLPKARSTASAENGAAKNKGSRVTVEQALRVLETDDAARRLALDAFRVHGGSLDRWQRSDREAMAGAMTRAEDMLESGTGARVANAREAIRAVRRRLELP